MGTESRLCSRGLKLPKSSVKTLNARSIGASTTIDCLTGGADTRLLIAYPPLIFRRSLCKLPACCSRTGQARRASGRARLDRCDKRYWPPLTRHEPNETHAAPSDAGRRLTGRPSVLG